MAFTVPVTLKQEGLVSPNTTVTKTTNITQEVVTQIQVVVPSGSTDYAVNLDILDTSKISLLVINTSEFVTFKFDNTGDYGWTYEVADIITLYNDSMRIFDNDLSATPSELATMYVTNPNSFAVTVNIVIVRSND